MSTAPVTPVAVRFVDAVGAHPRDPDGVGELFARDDGFFWIDVPRWDAEAEAFLTGLGCHPLLLEACRRRNYVPGYDDHVVITTQSPLFGEAGHVHLLEFDQIIGQHFLVTVHGPLNREVDAAQALVETGSVLRRIEGGRFRPTTRRPCPTRSPRPWRDASGH